MAGIVVVGSGVAGLACAWRLQRAGHEVEVLEQSPEIGGRLRSEVRGDLRLPRGAAFVTDGQRDVLGLAAALGLGRRVVSLDAPGVPVPGAILREGRFARCSLESGWGVLRSDVLPLSARLRLARLAAEVVRRRDRLDPVHPERAAGLEDGLDMPRFAARLAGESARDHLLAPAISALLGCEAEDVSSAFFLLSLRSLSQGAAPVSFEDGLDSLVRALAEPLAVRTGCEVFSVETERGGARVRYRSGGRERSFLSEAVVLAVPGAAVSDLCPALSPVERAFFGSLRYAPAITLNLVLDEAPAGLPFATAFSEGEGRGLRAIFQAHRQPGAAPPGIGLLTVSLDDFAVRRFAQAKDEEIAGFALDALARTPLGSLSPRESVVHRWSHARPLFPCGALARLEHFDARIARSPRLVFAGDYLVAPTVEGALTSGMRAASRVIQSLEDGAGAQPRTPADS